MAEESDIGRKQASSANQPRASRYSKNARSRDLCPDWLAQLGLSEKADLGNHVIRQWLAKYYSYYPGVKRHTPPSLLVQIVAERYCV